MPNEISNIGTELVTEVRGLRDEVKEVDSKRKKSASRTWLAIGLLCLSIVMLAFVSYKIYDCTVDGGDCREQAKTDAQLRAKHTQDMTMAVGYCLRFEASTEQQYLECVERKLPEYQSQP